MLFPCPWRIIPTCYNAALDADPAALLHTPKTAPWNCPTSPKPASRRSPIILFYTSPARCLMARIKITGGVNRPYYDHRGRIHHTTSLS